MHRTEVETMLTELFTESGKPTNSGFVVKDEEVAFMLMKLAGSLMDEACPILLCPACNAVHTVWWDWCNSLSGPVRIRLQRNMREGGIAFPPGPWEIIDTDAVPTALD